MATMTLKMDDIVKDTFNVVLEFIEGFDTFLTILKPVKNRELDYYCTGVVFGLQGSKVLVKVANTLGDKEKKESMKDPSKVGGWIESLGRGLINTAKNTYNSGKGGNGADGEL